MLPQVSQIVWTAIIAGIVLPLCMVESGAFLAYASMAGNVGVAVVVGAVLIRGAQISTIQPIADYRLFDSSNFAAAFGVIGFLYAASTTMITIHRAAKHKDRFAAVSAWGMLFTFVTCSAFALVCYLYFGVDTCSIVLLNIGGGALAIVAKVAIVIDLVFSYPLAMAGGREVLERSMFSDATPHLAIKQYATRTVMVAVAFLIGACMRARMHERAAGTCHRRCRWLRPPH